MNLDKNKKEIWGDWKDILFLTIIMCLVVIIKIILTKGGGLSFVDDASYFNMRKSLELIKNPILNFHDNLSFSGRTLIFLPGFEYLNALFLLLFNQFTVFFIIQKIFSALYLIPLYLITKKITNRESAAAATIIGATTPILFGPTTQNVLTVNISIFLFLFSVYSVMFIKKVKISLFILSFLALLATSTLSITLVLGLLIYLVIASIDKLKTGVYLETVLFSGALLLLTYGSLFSKLIQNNALGNIITHNVIREVNPLNAIYLIGFIPLILAVIELHTKLFNKEIKNKTYIYLLFSMSASSILIASFNTNEMLPNLMVLSSMMIILTGVYMKELSSKIKKSKVSTMSRKVVILILITIILTNSAVALIYTNNLLKYAPSKEEIEAMQFLRGNTPKESIIFAQKEYGNIINYYGRKNIVDNNIIGTHNLNSRTTDVNKVLNGISEVEALKILNKYKSNYLLCTKKPKFISKENEECFKPVFANGKFKIYKILCGTKVEEISINHQENEKKQK